MIVNSAILAPAPQSGRDERHNDDRRNFDRPVSSRTGSARQGSSDMPMKYIHRNGLPLLLRHTGPTSLPEEPPKSGSGPAILCLHDAGLQSSLFGDLLGALGATHRSLAFDLPGHGRSGSLDALPSIEAMTEMAAWVADWCRIERPILVGHGMGALVALEWARSQGDALGGLVLCGTGRALGVSEEAISTLREVTRDRKSVV